MVRAEGGARVDWAQGLPDGWDGFEEIHPMMIPPICENEKSTIIVWRIALESTQSTTHTGA